MSKYIPSPCPEWEEKIAATHPNDLSTSERQALEKHVESCKACADTLTQYLSMDTQLRYSSRVEPLPELPPELLKIWGKQDHQQVSREPMFAPFSCALMAYSLIVTGIGMYVIYRNFLHLPIWPPFDKVQISDHLARKRPVRDNRSTRSMPFDEKDQQTA